MATPIDVANVETIDKRSERPRRSKKWHWTPEEDALLGLIVQRNGAGNWDHVARHFHGRSGKSCRVRWINQLNPKIDKSPFSEEEQQKLLELHDKYGNRWSNIASFFARRTDNQLKNQYHVLMRNRCKKPTTPASASASASSSYSSDLHSPPPQGPISCPYTNTISNDVFSHGPYSYDFAPPTMNMPPSDSVQTIPFTMPGDFQMMPPPPSFPFLYDGLGSVPFTSNPFDGANMINNDIPHPMTITSQYHDESSILNVVNPSHQGEALKDHPIINFLGIQNPK